MSNSIFRKSSLDRVSSPEQLNEYIRVARPGVWLLLGAIVLLLLGVIVWGVFGTVTDTVPMGVIVENGVVIGFVSPDAAGRIEAGMPVEISGQKGSVISVLPEPVSASMIAFPAYLLEEAGLAGSDHCYAVELDFPGLENGICLAEITVERIRPITFVTQ